MNKAKKTKKVTIDNLAHMMQGLGSGIKGLDSKIENLGKSLDVKITRLESYMKEGFNSLNGKIDFVDARFSQHIEGLGKRMDDFAENKVSRITYKELESRVLFLESKILPKAKK